MSRRKPQPPWMLSLMVGDVIESATGTQRAVRKLTRYANGDLRSISVAIKHCSWTRRPYTILHYSDLKCLGYRPLGARVRLRGALDRKLAQAIADHNWCGLSCCDVRGVA